MPWGFGDVEQKETSLRSFCFVAPPGPSVWVERGHFTIIKKLGIFHRRSGFRDFWRVWTFNVFWSFNVQSKGSKSDEFSEKFQPAFDPPLIFEDHGLVYGLLLVWTKNQYIGNVDSWTGSFTIIIYIWFTRVVTVVFRGKKEVGDQSPLSTRLAQSYH